MEERGGREEGKVGRGKKGRKEGKEKGKRREREGKERQGKNARRQEGNLYYITLFSCLWIWFLEKLLRK